MALNHGSDDKKTPNNLHNAPVIWQSVMASAVIPNPNPSNKKAANLSMTTDFTNNGSQSDFDNLYRLDKNFTPEMMKKLQWQAKVKKLLRKCLKEKAKKEQNAKVLEGQLVSVTEDGYIIYKVPGHDGEYCVAGVHDVYRIRRADTMKAIKAGRSVCMCRAMGTCPLMAYSHKDPCNFCHDPMIIRHYPTDENWWLLRDKVKQLRKISKIDDEQSA